MKKIAIISVFIAVFTACKKDYTCTCKTPDGTTVAVENFEKTKKKAAQQQCVAYYNQEFGSIAFNETVCSIDE